MRMMIVRTKTDDVQTLGHGFIFDSYRDAYRFVTLELAWKNNERNVSSIPAGHYRVTLHDSPSQGRCFMLRDVKDRDQILIHVANFHTDLKGCIGVGRDFAFIDDDRHMDITSSRDTLDDLLALMPQEFDLMINNLYERIIT